MLRRVASIVALLACAAAAGCGGTGTPARPPVVASLAALDVKLQAPAQLRAAAPEFALRDSLGHLVRLSQLRGRAVLLTFIYTHCPDVCPLIVANLHNALVKMGAASAKLAIVAVSVDPKGDTPSTVKAFLAAHQMTGRMEYLVGSLSQLAPVWRAYGVQVQGSPDQREVSHSAFLYGITGRGAALVVYPPSFEPAWVAHDAPLLAGY